MSEVNKRIGQAAKLAARSEELYRGHQLAIYRRMDRLFALLMIVQWSAGIVAAFVISPRTWSGAMSQTHVHVWAAVLLGGAITSLPVYFALTRPGLTLTRHVVAIGQMLTSALLIHLTGGRIETHFHVFGSLALLACYRDSRVLVTSTVVVALDHWLRGTIWPESVFGVLTASWWRFLEHAAWVVVENICLAVTIRESLAEMKDIARQRAELEATNDIVESEVERRTDELHATMAELAQSHQNLEAAIKELEEKNSELDQFTYIASHDLQEPVRKLISFSDLLQQDLGQELNEQAARDIGFIVDAAQRMRQLVQDLLALSRAGRSAMKVEPVELDECVDHALQALELSINESGASIYREALPTIVGDKTMLTQLYQNLIGNALKFVASEKPEIHLTAEQDGAQWTLGVKDNGIGLKPEYAERIFQPFQRLHNRSEYSGTGIGLAICRKTVQRHGGEIYVESQPGDGAHFKFALTSIESKGEPCSTNSNQEKELSFC